MATHSECCRACKETIAKLLKKVYGPVDKQYSLKLSARLEGYMGEPCYEALRLIYENLQGHRGYQSFVSSDKLRKVDYFLPKQRMVVEFDESQHFTKLRYISLRLYPDDLTVGYDRARWMCLAAQLDRHDNDPVYRDEQRAWYDTLRDFSSLVLGNVPTARLYAKDRQWCLLRPDNAEDVALFHETYLGNL